jgi:hypothetical protein
MMLARRAQGISNRLRLLGLLSLMTCDAAGVDRALQCVDGLAPVEHAQQFATKDVVEKVTHKNTVRSNRPR